jgi:hypothetical protein
VLTEATNSRMDAYSSAIRLCMSTPLELRNFGLYRFTAGADTHFSSIFPCQLSRFFQQSHDWINVLVYSK